MRFNYYPETDSLYIDLAERPSTDSQEVAPGVVLDFDAEGRLVGIDIDHASQVVNLSPVASASPANWCCRLIGSLAAFRSRSDTGCKHNCGARRFPCPPTS